MASLRPADSDDAELSEINVTPFIDVMLVLLIIFMVAAPLSSVAVPVDLPAAAGGEPTPPQGPVYLTLGPDLALTLAESPVARRDLAAALAAHTGADPAVRIFLRADRGVDYGAVMEVMGLLRSAGYLKVALVGLDAAGPQAGTP